MPTEVRFFGSLSLYGLIIGTAYWFSSYEAAGTVLLLGFGTTTGVAFLVLRSGEPRPRTVSSPDGIQYPGRPDGPFGDESAPVPTRSAAPLAIGFGVAVMAMAGAFGPWFLVTGAIPVLIGAVDWLGSAGRELRQRDRAETRAAAGDAGESATLQPSGAKDANTLTPRAAPGQPDRGDLAG